MDKASSDTTRKCSASTFPIYLFDRFNRLKIDYCILHAYEDLPVKITSDIDSCVGASKVKDIEHILAKTCDLCSAKIIQKLHYDIPNAYYYVLGFENMRFLQLDFLNDNYGVNRYAIKVSEFLKARRKYGKFFIPTPDRQAAYILIKRTVKGKISNYDRDELRKLYVDNVQSIDGQVATYFGSDSIIAFRKLLSVQGYRQSSLVKQLRRAFQIRNFITKPNKWIVILYFSIVRLYRRVSCPTGLYVAILCPDGGGKSSVSKAVLTKLHGGFRRITLLHWRPGFLPKIGTFFGCGAPRGQVVAVSPHSSEQISRIGSFFRWLYYTIDYVIGYYLKILPMKIKTTAVIMDRYYYDIVVDPVRYGFNLPQWLLRLPLKIIPKPDLTIYLDNSPKELFKRKPELPVDELERQVKVWRELIPSLPNARLVTTNKPLDKVTNEVARLILDRRAEMTRKMLRIDPDESFYLWENNISSGYVGLPSRKNCRWIVPIKTPYAENAWNLYSPFTARGRLYKTFLRSLSAMGILGVLRRQKLDLGIIDESGALRRCMEGIFGRTALVPAISTGTPGPFRKITVMIQSKDGNILGYAKIGESALAQERVKNEAKVLKSLRDMRLTNFFEDSNCRLQIAVPECLHEGDIWKSHMLVESPISFEGQSGGSDFNTEYANALQTLMSSSLMKKRYADSDFCKGLKCALANYPLSYKNLLRDALSTLEQRVGDKEVSFTLSHGDFVPWNMLWSKDGRCFLFDWESAVLEAPAGIDLVHFLFQTGFSVKKGKGKALLEYIGQERTYDLLRRSADITLLPTADLVLIYLLHMAVTEDRPQQLSRSAVERRNLIKLILENVARA